MGNLGIYKRDVVKCEVFSNGNNNNNNKIRRLWENDICEYLPWGGGEASDSREVEDDQKHRIQSVGGKRIPRR